MSNARPHLSFATTHKVPVKPLRLRTTGSQEWSDAGKEGQSPTEPKQERAADPSIRATVYPNTTAHKTPQRAKPVVRHNSSVVQQYPFCGYKREEKGTGNTRRPRLSTHMPTMDVDSSLNRPAKVMHLLRDVRDSSFDCCTDPSRKLGLGLNNTIDNHGNHVLAPTLDPLHGFRVVARKVKIQRKVKQLLSRGPKADRQAGFTLHSNKNSEVLYYMHNSNKQPRPAVLLKRMHVANKVSSHITALPPLKPQGENIPAKKEKRMNKSMVIEVKLNNYKRKSISIAIDTEGLAYTPNEIDSSDEYGHGPL